MLVPSGWAELVKKFDASALGTTLTALWASNYFDAHPTSKRELKKVCEGMFWCVRL